MKELEGTSIIVFVLLAAFCFIAAAQDQDRFVKTPGDDEGPFYPQSVRQDEDNDLVHVGGRSKPAKGDILDICGVVLNTTGEPQKNLVIEIWQTDPQGRYNHPRDTSAGPLDPDFQYWGKTVTGLDGSFFFKTLVPGAYQRRPAHIHYKVWQDGRVLLTSQIYISTSPDTAKPLSTTPTAIESQTIALEPGGAGVFKCFFQIVL
jgi:protocatechuate 3,4-dioxygenase beta subunit